MKSLVIYSNQGNHSGFNRNWTISGKFNKISDARKEMKRLAFYCSDSIIDRNGAAYDLDRAEYLCTNKTDSFEYDLVYYMIVTEDMIDSYFCSGGHYGCLPQEAYDFFGFDI